ncbi:hypothetical protein [Saccharothrix syringae]|uniref:DUF5648 domain-containing protein n=1 Tax=Saccharothrix syringae TaxID=103733 RepID=A0A5Q0GZ42_SACSY|nr:hypothetical protein [Saccharothrix syringae]QFZ19291.1 hypothetical protein EKG83_19275 [Saccharothrix syringae]
MPLSRLVGRRALVARAVVALFVAVAAAVTLAPSANAASLYEPFYRLYNPQTGDNYNTTNRSEVVNLPVGYTYSGIDAFVSTTPQAGLVPFYRIYSPQRKDRFHTASWDEVVAATGSQGYTYEGIGAYVLPAGSGAGIPFHRLRHPGNGDHVLMTSQAEVNHAINAGYRYEGVAAEVG